MIVLRRSKAPFYFIHGNISDEVVRTLSDELSFYVEGYEYSKKYKKGLWDGRECLLRMSRTGTYYFPAGLLSRVCRVLEAFGIDYEIIEPEHEVRHLNLEWRGPKLRPYQEDAVIKALQKGSGVISLPTGAGKTLIGLKLIYALDCPTLVCVHTKELLYQWVQKVKEILGFIPGVVGDGHKDFRPITVGMIQTLTRMDIPEDYNMIIIDECHHIPADTFYRVAMKCNAVYRFGLSATPKREDGADIKIFAGVGEICANITAEQLIDQGYLAKPKFLIFDVPAKRLPRYSWQKSYQEGIVLHEQRNELIASIAKKFATKGLQTYVHTERIVHGRILAERIGCPFVCGKDSTEKRQRILNDFIEGKIRILVSTLLGEGVDIPEINAIIFSHGLKTSIGTIQKAGRALRVKLGKREAIIVDFNDKGPYISKHFEARMRAFKSYYGRYFKPILVKDIESVEKLIV
ncbi:MAG: DEAD/DEAH box helicase [Methermicoccaceae archaeon]